MKRPALVLVLCCAAGVLAFAQQGFSVGAGLEAGGSFSGGRIFNGMALGGGAGFDYRIKETTAAGVKCTASYHFVEKNVSLEPLGLVRWYYYTPSWGEFFAQAELGMGFLLESKVKTIFVAGASLGIRFPLKNFYLEPYLRGSYPLALSVGLMAGRRLK